jgi:hypothetical protein
MVCEDRSDTVLAAMGTWTGGKGLAWDAIRFTRHTLSGRWRRVVSACDSAVRDRAYAPCRVSGRAV